MQSMTGFGFVSVNTKDFKLEVSVKSVNSRFLDTKFYTSPCYMPLEPEMNKLISSKFQRGFFLVRIERYPQKPLPLISLNWDKEISQKWKTIYENVSKKMSLKKDLTISELIQKEGVIRLIEKPKNLSPEEKKTVKNSFAKALQSCIQERKREGQVLKKDILSHLRSMQSLLQKIKILNKKQEKKHLNQKADT